MFIPRAQVTPVLLVPLTDLTGAVEFCSGERLGEFTIVLCCCCFEFGSVWSSVGLFGRFGVSWLTGLTGEQHQPGRCRGLSVEVPRFH
jgi:hypothetical protein